MPRVGGGLLAVGGVGRCGEERRPPQSSTLSLTVDLLLAVKSPSLLAVGGVGRCGEEGRSPQSSTFSTERRPPPLGVGSVDRCGEPRSVESACGGRRGLIWELSRSSGRAGGGLLSARRSAVPRRRPSAGIVAVSGLRANGSNDERRADGSNVKPMGGGRRAVESVGERGSASRERSRGGVCSCTRKVDVRQPEKRSSNSRNARPVH